MFHVHEPHAALPLARSTPHIRALSAGVPGLGGAAGLCPELGSVLGGGRAAVPVTALTAPSLTGQGHASLLKEG